MGARTPEEICRLFQRYMAEGDLDAVLTLYDPEAVFLNQAGEVKTRAHGLREELAPMAASKPSLEFDLKQVVRAGDLALMHAVWTITGEQPTTVYAIEVARRQPDGSWRWLIGDPFTVCKSASLTIPSTSRS
jgi:ketosteroid isomerase-like protein